MSERVRNLLESIMCLDLYEKIEIEGENKKRKEVKAIVKIDDYSRMDDFDRENEIYGVNVVLKQDNTRIEFVHDVSEWVPYRVSDDKKTYTGRRAKSHFRELINRVPVIKETESVSEINLAKIMGPKGIKPMMKKYLQELMDNGAVYPEDKWLPLIYGDGMMFYESGLVQRRKVGHHYEYRVKELQRVQELLAR